MAEIPKDFGQGGAHMTPEGSGDPSLKTVLDDIADDLAALRAAHLLLTAKLDAEDVTNLDTDYASLTDPAAMKTTKEA